MRIICHCRNVTEEMVKVVIDRGARSIEDIAEQTGVCTGIECATKNPNGKCCYDEILVLFNKANELRFS